MKLLSRSLLLALATITGTATTSLAQSAWKTYSDRAGGYSISMPGQPKDQQERQYTMSSGDVLSYRDKTVLIENDQGIKVLYIVTYADLPVAYRKDSKTAQKALAGLSCQNSSIGDATQLVSQQTFRLSGLYLLLGATNHEPGAAKSIEGFMKSFKLR
jgi:hypothetical protein